MSPTILRILNDKNKYKNSIIQGENLMVTKVQAPFVNLTASKQTTKPKKSSAVGGGSTDGNVAGSEKSKKPTHEVAWLPYGVSPDLRNNAANNIVKFAR